jgi:uncharacterized integral membrane protein
MDFWATIRSLTLQDWANLATIVGLAFTVAARWITRERFSGFWAKYFKGILVVLLLLAGLVQMWRMGRLDWLARSVTWPLWALIVYPFVVIVVLICLLALAIAIDDRLHPREKRWAYFTAHGVRWYRTSGGFHGPPVCAECLMEMRRADDSRSGCEIWECRQCGARLSWDRRQHGDLLEDVRARYNAELRRRHEDTKA